VNWVQWPDGMSSSSSDKNHLEARSTGTGGTRDVGTKIRCDRDVAVLRTWLSSKSLDAVERNRLILADRVVCCLVAEPKKIQQKSEKNETDAGDRAELPKDW